MSGRSFEFGKSFEEYSKATTKTVLICPKCGSENTTFSDFLNHSRCYDCNFIDWDNQHLFQHKRISIVGV